MGPPVSRRGGLALKTGGEKRAQYLFRDAGPITRDAARIAVIGAAICYGDPPLQVFAAHGVNEGNSAMRRAYAPAAAALADVFKVSLSLACEALEVAPGSAYNARKSALSHYVAAANAARDALISHLQKDAPAKDPKSPPGDRPRRRGPPEPDFLPYEPKRVEITRRGLVPGAGQNVRPSCGRKGRASAIVPKVGADVLRWVAPAVRKGGDVAELADLFNLDPDALRLALSRAGILKGERARP